MRTINTGFNSGLVGNIASLLEEAYQAEGLGADVRYGRAVRENLEDRAYNLAGLKNRSMEVIGGFWEEDDSLPPDEIRVTRTQDFSGAGDEKEKDLQARMLRGDPA